VKRTLLALLPIAALAQEMTGPTLGWSPTSDGRSLQAIYGVAGAARLGPAVAWPEEVTGISVSPSGQRAVALENGLPVIVDLATAQRTPLTGATRADLKVWSPSGTALLLLDTQSGQVRTYRQQGRIFELLEEVAFAADAYAISDDGSSILAIAGEELLLRTAQRSSVLGRKTAGFTFVARSNTPVFIDGTELVIGTKRFAQPLEAPVLESPATGRILAIDRAGGKLVWFDAEGAQLSEASCHCVVDHIERLGTAGTLRLVTSEDGPAWLTETTEASQRLFFVPKAESAEEVKQ